MPNSPSAKPTRYSQAELQAILHTALSRQQHTGDYARSDLLETARELGLTEADISAAEAELAERTALQTEVNRQKRLARQGMAAHTLSFAVVNAGLYAVDLLTPGGPWFHWPLLGWGVGLAIHLGTTLFAGQEAWEEAARKRLERQRKREAREQAVQRVVQQLTGAVQPPTANSGEQRLDASVERLVDSALGAVASGLDFLQDELRRNRKDGKGHDRPGKGGSDNKL